jgi:hypothetical protein
MFSGPGDMQFVSFRAFEPTACEKMLMLQEMACLGNFGMACPECPIYADVAQLLYEVPLNPRVTLTRKRTTCELSLVLHST